MATSEPATSRLVLTSDDGDAWVARFDASGAARWVVPFVQGHYAFTQGTGDYAVVGVAAGTDGAVVVGGNWTGDVVLGLYEVTPS